jgi:hypothetical protein
MPEFAEQLGDGLMFQFETSPIDDEACRRSGDALDFDEAMGFERVACFNQVDDAIGQSDNRRQLNRAIELDDFDRHAALVEIALCNLRVFCGDADF